ncbi:hypothetical protein [Agarivorans sp. Toyoura001]|uniref:hypothetical protein n=1 Tax=Agarivorans sp. Toyoura001 TaxID=2283141 RepID=UPI0010F48198|nr:hypothetical protein [Agarivorans sp. Toyoura001]
MFWISYILVQLISPPLLGIAVDNIIIHIDQYAARYSELQDVLKQYELSFAPTVFVLVSMVLLLYVLGSPLYVLICNLPLNIIIVSGSVVQHLSDTEKLILLRRRPYIDSIQSSYVMEAEMLRTHKEYDSLFKIKNMLPDYVATFSKFSMYFVVVFLVLHSFYFPHIYIDTGAVIRILVVSVLVLISSFPFEVREIRMLEMNQFWAVRSVLHTNYSELASSSPSSEEMKRLKNDVVVNSSWYVTIPFYFEIIMAIQKFKKLLERRS